MRHRPRELASTAFVLPLSSNSHHSSPSLTATMPVFDKLHDLKHSLVGDEHEQTKDEGEDQEGGWSHKVWITLHTTERMQLTLCR